MLGTEEEKGLRPDGLGAGKDGALANENEKPDGIFSAVLGLSVVMWSAIALVVKTVVDGRNPVRQQTNTRDVKTIASE